MSVGRKVLSFSCRCSSLLLNYFVATIGFYRRRRLITKIYSVLVSVLHSLVGSFSQVWRNMHRHSSVLLLLTYFFFISMYLSLSLSLTRCIRMWELVLIKIITKLESAIVLASRKWWYLIPMILNRSVLPFCSSAGCF